MEIEISDMKQRTETEEERKARSPVDEVKGAGYNLDHFIMRNSDE